MQHTGRVWMGAIAVALLVVISPSMSAAETNVSDVVKWGIDLPAPVAVSNPVIDITWFNIGTNDVVWFGAVTNLSATWVYEFFDLYVGGQKCALRAPEVAELDILPDGRMAIPAGQSVAFQMQVTRRWLLPAEWQYLTFRSSGGDATLVPFGNQGYCEIVNMDEVFTFDREGNRVQNTDPDP